MESVADSHLQGHFTKKDIGVDSIHTISELQINVCTEGTWNFENQTNIEGAAYKMYHEARTLMTFICASFLCHWTMELETQ